MNKFPLKPFCLQALGVCVAALAFALSATAQSPIDDVHVVPRTEAQGPATMSGSSSGLAVHLKALRVDVGLVLVPVVVTDVKNRPVMDLEKQNFKLFESESEQPIQYFFAEDAPLSVGVLVDLSSSMADKVDSVRQAFEEFFRNAHPDDDYFVITFADRPQLLANTTQSVGTIQEKLGGMKAKGSTALADAIYLGVTKLHSTRYRRKALVIISDGGDNNSRYTLREVKNLARESDAQIYAIDVCDALPVLLTKKIEERLGKHWLDQVTESTGGRTIAVDDASKIPDAAARISMELRNQYVLGYRPASGAQDGKWRKIKVRVIRRPDQLPLQVYYKTGYIASRQ